MKGKCVICNHDSIGATFHDFKFDKDGTPIHWALCRNCTVLMANLSLESWMVKKLWGIAGGETFLTHYDFYDEDGNALQPSGGL